LCPLWNLIGWKVITLPYMRTSPLQKGIFIGIIQTNQPYFRQVRKSSFHPPISPSSPIPVTGLPSVGRQSTQQQKQQIDLVCFCVLYTFPQCPCSPSTVGQQHPVRLVTPPCIHHPTALLPEMVRTPFSLFDTAPILSVRRPSTFLGLPSISTHPHLWTKSSSPAPSYPYMNARPRYLRRPTTQSPRALSALETSFSPSKTIESLRMHRWNGASSLNP
jgi:hypothetical protein